MSRYQVYKNTILDAKKCADGLSIAACPSCLADRLASIEANLCWYCRDARITRALTLCINVNDKNLMHLVCERCAEALDGQSVTFEKSEDQV